MNEKLIAINSLSFVDWSCSGGECEYVLIENTPENRNTLLNVGFTGEQLEDENVKIDVDDEVLDVAYIAFSYANADWFNPKYQKFCKEAEL